MDVPEHTAEIATPTPSQLVSASARDAGLSLIRNLSVPKAFPDVALEAQFLEDHSRRFCAFRRASALLALSVWVCFLWYDFNFGRVSTVLEPVFMDIMALRFAGIVWLMFVLSLALRGSFATHAASQRVTLMGVYGCNLLLLLLVSITPRPFNYTWYFVGLYLVFFFQFGFFYLKSKVALTAAVVTFSSIILLQLTIRILSPEDFYMGMFYLFNVVVIGHGVCVHAERVSRERFSAERALGVLNNELLTANVQLERKNLDLLASKKDQDTKTRALISLKEQQTLAAETASKEKSNFLAAATHDLRQPMHALNLFLQAAAEAVRHDDVTEAARLIDESGRSSVILARFLNAVLDLSRLESGRVMPRYHVFDLKLAVFEVAEQLRPLAAMHGVDLRLRMPAAPVYVRSDSHWLQRAIANLVSNGIRYADAVKNPKPVVIVGVVRSATRTRIDVVDNGIGIASEHWDAIFQPFFQVGNAEQDNDRGLGLGLSIVNAVVSMLEEHRIELKSAEGRGSRFSLEMPICGSPLGDAAPRAKGDTADYLEVPLEGLYVLLVEDDSLVRASTEALLVQWGVLFDSASSFEEFEQILGSIERYPDLIITDFRLRDEKTAREVAMLGAAKLGRRCPCLVVTGEPAATIVPLACDHDVLSKPVSPAELRRQMASLISGRSFAEAAWRC
ncbi:MULTISPECIES: ATP-binding response regulator [Burkholderiaceae]|uniref:histidine kinase n=1 Tax=Caballeronia sordidicola TaxID=196367 RepID=A0A242MV64_CABSO|nr:MULTISPECIES: hybrid sensor histidine kinase/response regulator [Burkholderiaceae]AME25668.1 hybrid sensor histidine kinase/response regulator [Burkholderia sp. PAMC 26561]OTP75328.1 Two-component hybrid sensor and regulator [Caballeronia sordidicola]